MRWCGALQHHTISIELANAARSLPYLICPTLHAGYLQNLTKLTVPSGAALCNSEAAMHAGLHRASQRSMSASVLGRVGLGGIEPGVMPKAAAILRGHAASLEIVLWLTAIRTRTRGLARFHGFGVGGWSHSTTFRAG